MSFIFCFQAKGKIVVFNEKYVSYGESVKYRDFAAAEAAKLGAVATLVRYSCCNF
jgi:carboxypeptidase Q